MIIHFIRHTTPNIASGVCYGQSDIALADSFPKEAELVTNKLKQQQNLGLYKHIFSSPAKRCCLLAEEVQRLQETSKQNRAQSQNSIIIDNKLQEIHFGDWELKTWKDIPREESQAWTDDFIHVSPPNGESLLQMQQRVNNFIDSISTYNAPIVVITHAGVMRLIASYYLNIPLIDIFNLRLNFGQIIELTISEGSHSLRFID